MKKIYLTIAMFTGVIQAFAQIQIVRSDLGQVGDKVYYATIDTFATQVNVGASGANKVWDFNSLTPLLYDSAIFTDPSFVPDAPTSANLAIVWGNEEDNEYWLLTDSGLQAIVLNPVTSDEIVTSRMPFPINYGMAGSDTVNFSITGTPDELDIPFPVDSVRITAYIRNEMEFDAWGSLTIPSGTFDALRMKNVGYTDVLIEVQVFGNWSELGSEVDTTYAYTWFGKDKKYQLAYADADKNGIMSFFEYQVNAIYPNSVKELLDDNSVKLYPNPANENISVSIEGVSAFTYNIVDITGRTVLRGTTSGNATEINISTLKNGLYTLNLYTENAKASRKVLVHH